MIIPASVTSCKIPFHLNTQINQYKITIPLLYIIDWSICNDQDMEVRESSRQIREPIDESSETLFVNRRRCCFYFPCFDRSKSSSSSTDAEINETSGSLWNRSVAALMKIREWSEIVAGPRWKTFIRRFNRNRSGNNSKQGNFQYDPLSYAMNFDEGPAGQNSHFDEVDDEFYYGSMNFSSRYAKGSMDLSKEGTSFV